MPSRTFEESLQIFLVKGTVIQLIYCAYYSKEKHALNGETTYPKLLRDLQSIAPVENRSVDPLRVNECRERLALPFEKGLKSISVVIDAVCTILSQETEFRIY